MDLSEISFKGFDEFIWLSMGHVDGCCDHDNNLSGSLKGGEFLDLLRVLLPSQEGLYFMQSVSQSVS
jgi:hypothetical protein